MKKSPPNVRGCFNFIGVIDERLVIAGWALDKYLPIDTVKLLVNGEVVDEQVMENSDDVAKAYPFIPHSGRSVFHVSCPYVRTRDILDIDVVGYSQGLCVGKMETWFAEDLRFTYDYPDHLKVRVANNADKNFFYATSLTSFRNFYSLVEQYADELPVRNVLDWGCGIGRLATMFIHTTAIESIFGCDIDAESINWCRENLRGDYSVVPLHPPTSYSADFFDLIVSQSVLTHLTRKVQLEWLAEMRRILRPGGLFLASVHGEFATFFEFEGRVEITLTDEINDGQKDHNLDGVIEDGYYRGTFQREAYTRRIFGQYFEVLEYIVGGSGNYQDIVVMRKTSLD